MKEFEGVFDLEGNGLLDHTTINYLTAPFTLKPTFRLWCAVIIDINTGQTFRYVFGDKAQEKAFIEKFNTLDHIIGHNIVDYDLLALKLYFKIEYIIDEQCTLNGRPVRITDTLVLSKVLNPDRYGGHSLDEWGKRLGELKIDWRAVAIELGLIESNAPKGAEFQKYHPKMLEYNEQDCKTNVKLYWHLKEEIGTWDWTGAIILEHMVRDIITRQSHRGFWFNQKLASENLRDLDEKMEAIRITVEPLLPPKSMGITKMKAYYPPKIQFLKNGKPSKAIENWTMKHAGKLYERGDEWYVNVYDKEWKLPMDVEVAVQTHEPATVRDTTHIKGWLVGLGWKPTQYKERDLTCDAKKNKLSQEKFTEAVERYVEQTLHSPFCKDRCVELECSSATLRNKLLKHDIKRPLKVYTNPTITVGMEKDIDPALLELADKFPHAKLISEYMTYSHRRNSILGGGIDPDEWDERDDDDIWAGKGFLAADRVSEDGRIPTPADTCGAGTSRFKHRLVANIPRVTSLYGDRMRGLFGVDTAEGYIQLGYDFSSLEANIEAHYVFKYKGGPEYGVSLTAAKPNDCHTVLATKISALIKRAFPRSSAKNVKYGCSYNAQPPRVAKTVGCSLDDAQVIFDAFWELASPLKELKEKMQKYWETTGQKKFLMGLDNRKLPIRSKGNVINTAFQSAGVIAAKRAMVIHERLLREEGMIVDFFRDDWKNRDFCQQLIAYHDEAQLEVKRSMVTWKKFATENECKTFISEDGKIWSEPVHNESGWWRGYCRAGELASIAVRMSGEYYNLNVKLSADYALGRNWAECH